jgi:PAS domain S-box-containing protein
MRSEMFGVNQSAKFRYGIAVVSITVATGMRFLLDPIVGEQFPFATLFFAVLVATWYGGFGPGIVATALGTLAGAWLLVPPRGSLFVHGFEQNAGLVLYQAVSLGIALLGREMRAAKTRAETLAVEAIRREEQVRTTLSSIGDGVIVADPEMRIVSLNATAERLTGWTTAEAAGRSLQRVFRIIDGDTRQPIANTVTRVFREGVVVDVSAHILLIAKDGTELPVDASAAPIGDGAGGIGGVVVAIRDVSARRRAERELQESEERFRLMANTAPVLIWMSGLDRLCVFFTRP